LIPKAGGHVARYSRTVPAWELSPYCTPDVGHLVIIIKSYYSPVSDWKSNKEGALRELDLPSMCDLSFPSHPSLFQWRYLREPYHLFVNGLIASCAMLLLVVQSTVTAIFPCAEAFRCNRLPFRTYDLSDLIKLATLGGSSPGYLGRVSCLMGSGNKKWVIRLPSLLAERLERLEMP
jgi:hypothetical protein